MLKYKFYVKIIVIIDIFDSLSIFYLLLLLINETVLELC
jgi:hypothetical protein